MSELKQLLTTILDLAERTAPFVEAATGKGEMVTAAAELARSVLRLTEQSAVIFGEEDQAKLQAARAALEARVNAHADRTIASLG